MDSNVLSIIVGVVALLVGVIAGRFIFAKNTQKQVEDIARLKMPDLNTDSLASAIKTVSGTARSMGLDVVG